MCDSTQYKPRSVLVILNWLTFLRSETSILECFSELSDSFECFTLKWGKLWKLRTTRQTDFSPLCINHETIILQIIVLLMITCHGCSCDSVADWLSGYYSNKWKLCENSNNRWKLKRVRNRNSTIGTQLPYIRKLAVRNRDHSKTCLNRKLWQSALEYFHYYCGKQRHL